MPAPIATRWSSKMADRLAALAGELVVKSSPGAGTTVTGRVPVRIPG
jgi:hypothetical protein